ncbi:MAG: hypothetical protein M3462_01470 [Chloroflexota bacterium]|nr:hypothetical protein [Chloroflexota bacterium]
MWFARGKDTRADELDRFLDEMTRGRSAPASAVEPALLSATRHVHGLAATGQPSDRIKASVWEDVMDATRSPRPASQPAIGSSLTRARPGNPAGRPTASVPSPDMNQRRRMGARLATAAMLLTVLVVGYVVAQVAFRPPADDQRDLAVVVATPGPVAGQECQVEPRTIDEIVSILSTQVMPRPTSTSEWDVVISPRLTGGVAPEIIATIQATQREWNACGRTGDVLRQSALMTDAYIRRSPWFDMWGGPNSEEIRTSVEAEVTRVARLAAAAPPGTPAPDDVPLGAETLVIHDEDVRQLPDGRVGALLREENPSGGITSPLPFNTFRIFVQVDDRWLIDQDIMAGG